MRRIIVLFLSIGILFGVNVKLANALVMFSTDFDSGPVANFSGITNIESVQGYAGIGSGTNTFSGNFLRNTSGNYYTRGTPGGKTILTLTDLPEHTSFDLNFLFAAIDSWDGIGTDFGPDYFNVTVDGTTLFSESFDHLHDYSQTYNPPSGVLLTPRMFADLGFSPVELYYDGAYNFGLDPIFNYIPHVSETLIIEWWADGAGWQGATDPPNYDESWGMDNVEIVLNRTQPVPEPATMLLFGTGLVGFAAIRRRV